MSAASYGKAMIESRRRADNAYKAMDAVIAQDRKILQIANFENHTAQKIERLAKAVSYILRVIWCAQKLIDHSCLERG